MSAIAKKLNELHILSPKEYKKSTGLNYRGGFTGGSGSQWSSSSVKRILTNEVYLGHLLQGKTEKVNYKVKRVLRNQRKNGCVRKIPMSLLFQTVILKRYRIFFRRTDG